MRTKVKGYALGAFFLSSVFLSSLSVGLPAIAQVPFHTRWPAQSNQQSNTAPQGTAPQSIRQPIRQHERVYVSTSGEFLGAHTILEGNVLFIDRSGEINLAARDYTAELGYDYTGRLSRIGAAPISYDYRGRVDRVGNSAIDYDFRSRIGQIDGDEITYTPRGQISQVGTVTLQYDSGAIETISSNYTSAGTQIVILKHRRGHR